MNKEKMSYNEILKNNSEEKLTDPSSSKDSYMDKMKQVYLPESQNDYHPSEESIERVNGLTSDKSTPVADAISRDNNN